MGISARLAHISLRAMSSPQLPSHSPAGPLQGGMAPSPPSPAHMGQGTGVMFFHGPTGPSGTTPRMQTARNSNHLRSLLCKLQTWPFRAELLGRGALHSRLDADSRRRAGHTLNVSPTLPLSLVALCSAVLCMLTPQAARKNI